MTKYIIDTNLYVEAQRNPAAAALLERFYANFLPFTFLSAVVAQELLLGAGNRDRGRRIRQTYLEPFERRGRLVTPRYASWKRSGEVVAALVHSRVTSSDGYTRSFLNDVLLAVSCREAGMTLVTANLTDFEHIRQMERFNFVPPWPDA